MGIFGGSSPFDQIVEKVTDEKSSEDWGLIMEVCDRVTATNTGPKECLKSIYKRLQHQDPHVVLQALTLLDACVNNCGQYFLLEVASRDFETEYRKILSKSHPKVQDKMRGMLKKWAEGEFSKDPKFSLIPSFYSALKREGHDFAGEEGVKIKREVPKDPNVVSSQQEQDDLLKAIQLSLQEKSGGTQPSTAAGGNALYPTENLYSSVGGAPSVDKPFAAQQKNEKKARCLYDFEAVEDNELTFKSGEILMILDDQDPNWWKGSNHRGEGLFPANFVSLDLDPEPERRKSVQFNEEVEVKTVEKIDFAPQLTIDEGKIDELLGVLHEADPLEEVDPPFLPQLEEQVGAMGPLIDTELEKIDRQHAKLTRLSRELVESLTLYHTLMAEAPSMPYQSYGMPGMHPGFMPQMQAMGGMPPMSMAPGGMPMPQGMQPMGMPGGMPQGGMPGMPIMQGMPPTSMPGIPPTSMPGMPPTSMPGMPPTSMPGMPPTSMPGMPQSSMPGMGMPPNGIGMQAPMYYMDPNMAPQGGYPAPQGYPGSAPPPTPPLYDPNMAQQPYPVQNQQ